MDVHRLRVFRSVIASGSVQAAAQHLGYTPSAVSQHLKQLQSETGLQLFEKAGRGIAPTPAGTLLAEASDDAVTALARLDDVVSDLRSGRVGALSIGCFASAGEEWVPGLVQQLRQEFPDLHLDIDLTEVAGTGRGQAPCWDLEIRTEVPGVVPHVPSGYIRVELVTEPYYVVLPADHPLAALDAVPLAALADQPWVDESDDEQTCGQILDRAVRSAGFSPRLVARCMDHHTAMALVAAGVGVTLVPELTLGALPEGTTALVVTDPTPRRRIAVLVRDAVATRPAARRAVGILSEVARGWSGPQTTAELAHTSS